MTKLPFPKEYIKTGGDFPLNSGQHSRFKCEVEELLLDRTYYDYVMDTIPVNDHYVGIATGGMIMAFGAWWKNRESKLSYIKNGFLMGPTPNEGYTLIDDVVTTGGSLVRAMELIGKKPREILVAADRREKKGKIKGIEVITSFEPIDPRDFDF